MLEENAPRSSQIAGETAQSQASATETIDNYTDELPQTAKEEIILRTVRRNDPNQINSLIDKGVTVDALIKVACQENQRELLLYLLHEKSGSLIDAIWYAAFYKKEDLLEDLLAQNGSDIKSALRGAATGNHLSFVDILLAREGTEVSDALWSAAWSGHRELVDHLLNKPEAEIGTALNGAANNNQRLLIDYLLTKKGAEVERALCGAAYQNDFDLIEYLLGKEGAKINDVLWDAAHFDNLALVERLLAKDGAKVNKALRAAACYNRASLVKHLLGKPDANLEFALNVAIEENHSDLVTMLVIECGADISDAIKEAASNGKAGIIEALLTIAKEDAAPTTNTPSTSDDERPHTRERLVSIALFFAALVNNREVIDLLLDRYQANVNVALAGAAAGGELQLIDYLLTKEGANIDAALEGAIERKKGLQESDTIDYLVEHHNVNPMSLMNAHFAESFGRLAEGPMGAQFREMTASIGRDFMANNRGLQSMFSRFQSADPLGAANQESAAQTVTAQLLVGRPELGDLGNVLNNAMAALSNMQSGHSSNIINSLVSRGAFDNLDNDLMMMVAGMAGRSEVIEGLQSQHGANTNTALSAAVLTNRPELVASLKDNSGANLDLALAYSAFAAIDPNMTDYLVAQGANVNAALFSAAMGNNLEEINRLVMKDGADLNFAVLGASSANHVSLVQELLKRNGARVNSALFGAALRNNHALVEELLQQQEADVNEALFGAAAGNHRTLVELLLSKQGAKIESAATGAALGNNLQLVLTLLNEKNADIIVVLHTAAAAGHKDLIEHLLTHYLKSHNYDANQQRAAFSLAAMGGIWGDKIDLVKYLLSTYQGRIDLDSVLEMSAKCSQSGLVEDLLAQPNVHIQERTLASAAEGDRDDPKIIELLLDNTGREMPLLSEDGEESALAESLKNSAINKGNRNILNYLESLITAFQDSMSIVSSLTKGRLNRKKSLDADLQEAEKSYTQSPNDNTKSYLYQMRMDVVVFELMPRGSLDNAQSILQNVLKQTRKGFTELSIGNDRGLLAFTLLGMIENKKAIDARFAGNHEAQRDYCIKAEKVFALAGSKLSLGTYYLLEAGKAVTLALQGNIAEAARLKIRVEAMLETSLRESSSDSEKAMAELCKSCLSFVHNEERFMAGEKEKEALKVKLAEFTEKINLLNLVLQVRQTSLAPQVAESSNSSQYTEEEGVPNLPTANPNVSLSASYKSGDDLTKDTVFSAFRSSMTSAFHSIFTKTRFSALEGKTIIDSLRATSVHAEQAAANTASIKQDIGEIDRKQEEMLQNKDTLSVLTEAVAAASSASIVNIQVNRETHLAGGSVGQDNAFSTAQPTAKPQVNIQYNAVLNLERGTAGQRNA